MIGHSFSHSSQGIHCYPCFCPAPTAAGCDCCTCFVCCAACDWLWLLLPVRLMRFGRLAALTGSVIVSIPFSNFVWIPLVSIGLGKVTVRSNAPETISRESQLCPARWRCP